MEIANRIQRNLLAGARVSLVFSGDAIMVDMAIDWMLNTD